MEDVLIPAVIFGSIVAIVKIVSDTRTRRQLIERGLVDDSVRQMLETQTAMSALSNVKWGMVLVAVGAAIFVSRLIDSRWWADEGMFGLMCVFAGLAFLLYYPLAQGRLREIESRRKNPSSIG